MCTPASSHAVAAECRSVCAPTPFHADSFGRRLNHPQQVSRLDNTAQLGREHQASVVPLVGCAHAFL